MLPSSGNEPRPCWCVNQLERDQIVIRKRERCACRTPSCWYGIQLSTTSLPKETRTSSGPTTKSFQPGKTIRQAAIQCSTGSCITSHQNDAEKNRFCF